MKKIFFLSFLLVFAFSFTVKAEEQASAELVVNEAETNSVAVTADTTVETNEVSTAVLTNELPAVVTTNSTVEETVQNNQESNTVPSNFGLWWRGIRERISLSLTLNPVKKAEKLSTFAEERIKLAEDILAQAGDDEKLAEKAQTMLENANKLINQIGERQAKLQEKKDERAERVLEKTANQMLRKEIVLKKLETKLNPEKQEKLEQLRQESLINNQKMLEMINLAESNPELANQLKEIKDKMAEMALENKAQMETRRALLEKIKAGDETAKEELKVFNQEIKENLADRKEERKELLEERKDVIKEIRQEMKEEKKELLNQAKQGDKESKEQLKEINKIQKENLINNKEKVEIRKEMINDIKEKRQEIKQELKNKVQE